MAGKQPSSKKRRAYTAKEKLKILSLADEAKEKGETLRKFCERIKVQPVQIRRWKKVRNKLEEAKANVKSLCSGRPYVLDKIEDDLLTWFFEMRERGFTLNTRQVVIRAGQLDSAFRHKTERAKFEVVKRFLKTHSIVGRAVTHEAQKDPQDTKTTALQFIESVIPRLLREDRHQSYILNMDQTPIFFYDVRTHPGKPRFTNRSWKMQQGRI